MTYDAYAMFKGSSYHIAHGNCQEAVLDRAKRVCSELGVGPMAFIAGRRGELTLNCKLFGLEDLKKIS